ncbi:DUF6752 domain-containing protein [Nocardioides panacisoli]|uniref:DUF6752 domain-containing protein n=1 Tax=Nocardioides panacisoli TaxID=627624 RepID=A0ABP7ITK2_9ACTN
MPKAEETEEQLSGSRWLLAGTFRRMTGLRQLEDRVAALEAEVRTIDPVHVRLAELIDLVQELLLPVAQQDQDKVAALVEKYTDELGA